MDKKQQDQLKKGLVFGGLGLLFALSMWFILRSDTAGVHPGDPLAGSAAGTQ